MTRDTEWRGYLRGYILQVYVQQPKQRVRIVHANSRSFQTPPPMLFFFPRSSTSLTATLSLSLTPTPPPSPPTSPPPNPPPLRPPTTPRRADAQRPRVMRALQRHGAPRLRGDVLDARVSARGGDGTADEERRPVRPRGVQRAPAVRRQAHGDRRPHGDGQGGRPTLPPSHESSSATVGVLLSCMVEAQ